MSLGMNELEQRLNEQAEENERLSKMTDEELLMHRWREGDRLEREGKALKAEVRAEAEELIRDGVRVCDDASELVITKSTRYKADIDKIAEKLGADVALRVADVASSKLRKILDIGLIKGSEVGEEGSGALIEEVVSERFSNKAIKR